LDESLVCDYYMYHNSNESHWSVLSWGSVQ